MNYITKIVRNGDNLYINVSLNGMKSITIKFFEPTGDINRVKFIEKAINYNAFKLKNVEDEDGYLTEGHPQEELIKNINAYIEEYDDFGISGIYDSEFFNSLHIKVTELGKKKFVTYLHDGMGIFLTGFGFSKEEAFQDMIYQTIASGRLKNCVKKTIEYDRTNLFYKTEESCNLFSIDTVEELIKYKILSFFDIEHLSNAGLIECTGYSFDYPSMDNVILSYSDIVEEDANLN